MARASPSASRSGSSVTAHIRLGDMLVGDGILHRHELEECIKHLRGRIGEVLRAHGLVHGRQLADALAKHHRLKRVDLHLNPPARALFTPRDLRHYNHHHYIPHHRDEAGFVLATSDPSEHLRAFAIAHYNAPIEFVVCSARELRHSLAEYGATTSTRHARLGLRRQFRHLVADRILTRMQLRGLALLLAGLLALGYFVPHGWQALLVACNLFYAVSLALKLLFYHEGAKATRDYAAKEHSIAQHAAALVESTLPTYSILVPMYHETSDTMARLIANLTALDYPRELLDIKLILEADDTTTLIALKALNPPEMMEIIAVPPSNPRTKPKACNVALQRVRGEYVVIYDAEDHPAPDQLKRAVHVFRENPEHLACLQASLNYYNRDETLLTQMFAMEYSALFRLLLPALARLGMPIPLGGTSNHLKTAALREAGGWDAFNVTEDADLGVRLAYLGYSTQILPSLTLEESPISIDAWLKQRSRWIKGYIQTWLVYTRDRRELRRRLGNKGYYGFQFFIGAPALTFLLAPLFWATFLISLTGIFPASLSPEMQILCGFSLIGSILSHWLFARKTIQIEGWRHIRAAFWLYPFYWLLHSLAAAKALIQLITAPHYWEKTSHGLSKLFPQPR